METITAPPFAVGQLWRCKGRSAQETPSLLINRIETHPLGGQIFHVTLYDVHLRNPRMPGGITKILAHVPVTLETLRLSVTGLEDNREPDPAYVKGWQEWRRAFDAGQAGSFGVPVDAILEFVERRMNS
jgi:hypothetical protein